MNRTFSRWIAGTGIALAAAAPFALAHIDPASWLYYGWPTFAHSPTHAAQAPRPTQPLNQIHWTTPVDLAPQYSGSILYIHYGTPLVTRGNTVIVTVKVNPNDTFKIEGRAGSTGALKWTLNTDYVVPSAGWYPSVGSTLTPRNTLAVPAIGGTVLHRTNADLATATVTRQAFYGIANYNANPSAYDNSVKINTPIVCDSSGNLYFGFDVTGSTPIGLTSGIARIAANGTGSWVSAQTAAGNSGARRAPVNCAPALSTDESVLYTAIRDTNGEGFLVGLNASTLAPLYSVRLKDPASNQNSYIFDDGTNTPCVGPDGDVYYGVFEAPFWSNHLRGWMNHYDATLTQTKTPGAFGWDNTPTVVPASCVPSYTGSSSYLLMTKYNDYAQGGGQGINQIAVLDPNATQIDPVTGATVMLEVLTKPGPTPDPSNGPLAVKEWCINTCAFDPWTKSALPNCEDGKLYRWDLTTNTLSQTVTLTAGLGEAYTPTIIGPDGQVYAINNAILFAVGQ